MAAPKLGSVCTTSAAAFYDSSCVLAPLAPLTTARTSFAARSAAPPVQGAVPLTLSDCSELSSATSRDDNKRSTVAVAASAAAMAPCVTRSKPYQMKRRTRCARGYGGAGGGGGGGGGGGTHAKSSGGKKVRSSKSNIPGESRYWTPSEHKLFIEALWKFGPKNLKAISVYVGTRNMIQCRTHEQKCFMRLMREAQRENVARNGSAADKLAATGAASSGAAASATHKGARKLKTPKDVYSVSPQCGLLLLCAVSEEMSRSA